jgi:hypothetical protein
MPTNEMIGLQQYCAPIELNEYERQKTSNINNAISDLLEQIITDENLSPNDRRKKLKKVSIYKQ